MFCLALQHVILHAEGSCELIYLTFVTKSNTILMRNESLTSSRLSTPEFVLQF